ncbi:MAG: hypothetical protein ACRD8Z_12240 [Nitrososphaeraceae archaeon]
MSVSLSRSTDMTACWKRTEDDNCYDAGFEDGQNEPFSQSTYDHCGDEQGECKAL